MTQSLVVVMAKGASERVPEKNIAPVGDRRLIDFTFDHIAGIKTPRDVTVLTESKRVAKYCLGRHISWEQPEGGQGQLYARIDKAVKELEANRGEPYRYVILLQPDCPIRPANLTDRAIEIMEETGCDIVASVVQVPVQWHYHRMYAIRAPGDLAPLAPVDPETGSQSYPVHHVLTGGIYALSRSHLSRAAYRGGIFPGVHARPIVMELSDCVEIDYLEDLEAFRRRVESGDDARLSQPLAW